MSYITSSSNVLNLEFNFRLVHFNWSVICALFRIDFNVYIVGQVYTLFKGTKERNNFQS
jgi:hypothetical protein